MDAQPGRGTPRRMDNVRARLGNLLGGLSPGVPPLTTLLSPEVFWRTICGSRQPVLLLSAQPLAVLQASDEALALLGVAGLPQAQQVLLESLDAQWKVRLSHALENRVVLEGQFVRLNSPDEPRSLRLTVASLPEYPEKGVGLLFLSAGPERTQSAWPKAIWDLTSKLPYAVWVVDAQGKVLYGNEAYRRFPLNQPLPSGMEGDAALMEIARSQLRTLPDHARLSKNLMESKLALGRQGNWQVLHFVVNPNERKSRVCALAFKVEPSSALPNNQSLGSQEFSALMAPAALVKILQAREDERLSIGREIHDYLGSELTVLRMELHRLQHIVKASSAPEQVAIYLNSVCAQTEKLAISARRIAYNLRQEFVTSCGLTQSVHDLVLDMRYRVGMDIQLEFNPDWIEPEDPLARHMYRSAQELLNNVSKHAKATRCLVRLGLSDRSYWLEVQDNGVGLDTNTKRTTVGFKSLSERAALYDGSVYIQSRPQVDGTLVRVTMLAR